MVKSETTLTFYGGVNEIGGNKILLKDGNTKILLDFGMSFSLKRRYYSPPFLSPRSEKSLLELGILPKISGLYIFDKESADVDAVLISHGHMDHSAYISFIKREIPVYCGETTKIILQALGEIRRTDLEFNVEGIEFKTFRTGSILRVDDVEIKPIHVDHSVPGAYGFIIQTSNGTIVYTGDFRVHGIKSEMTYDFVEAAKKADPVAIITEATNMTSASASSEAELRSKLNGIVGQTEGVVLAEFASTDIDRLNSFYQAAENNGRCLVVSSKQAYLMEMLRSDSGLQVPSLDDKNIMIFRRSKPSDNGKKVIRKWEKQLMESYADKFVDCEDISNRQCKMLLSFSLYDLDQLVEVKPAPGSCYISSSSEPFNEEMEIDFERLVNWLRYYGLPRYHVHVSGHVMPFDLKNTLQNIHAARIFPVHTEDAELFAKFIRGIGSEIVHVEKGEEYLI
ncbi:MAG: MBL fold metallo-hydrolase [Candidatus Bathyarchaeota archaeon]|nr:MBL fold metallo-hydrolase [Candidatus Bathyarchaeota archaeon]